MPFETRDIERHLLKMMTTNKLLARMHFIRMKEKWFTGSRRVIYMIARHNFEETHTLLSDALFEVELSKRFPTEKQSAERDTIETEWKLVQQQVVEETADALIQKLVEKEAADGVTDMCGKALELLQKGHVQEATEFVREKAFLINTAHDDKPLINLTDFEHRERRIEDFKREPEKYRGIRSGFREFDRRTGGLFKAELTLIAAVTGVGKSTFMKMIGRNVVLAGRNVLHVTNEEHREQVEMKYDALFSEIDYLDFKIPLRGGEEVMTEEKIKKWKEVMEDLRKPRNGHLFIKELPQFDTVATIYQTFVELEQQGNRPHLIIIDYLDHLGPIQKAWGENDEQAKVAHDCKGLAIDLNVPVIAATQAATLVEKKQESGKRFGKMDVYGSKRRIHASNTFIGIMIADYDHTQLKDEGGDRDNSNQCDKFWSVEVLKNRDGPPFRYETRHVVRTGVVVQENWSKSEEGKEKLEEEAKEMEKEAKKKEAESKKEPPKEEETPKEESAPVEEPSAEETPEPEPPSESGESEAPPVVRKAKRVAVDGDVKEETKSEGTVPSWLAKIRGKKSEE